MTNLQNPGSEDMWDGIRHIEVGDFSAALDSLTEAINLQPSLVRARRERATAYRQLGKEVEARADERAAENLTRQVRRNLGVRQAAVRDTIGETDGGTFSFEGPIGRRTFLEYWVVTVIFIGAAWFFGILLGFFGGVAGTLGALLILVAAVAAAWIGLASAAKRFRDLGQEGVWAILTLIPVVGFFVWIILLFSPGKLNED